MATEAQSEGEVPACESGRSDAICSFVICNDSSLRGQPIIFNPDFFVEKLRHEKPEVFTELVVSNITRLIDLPGTELAQLMGEVDLKLPGGAGAATGFFRSLMSLKRKGKRGVGEGCTCLGGFLGFTLHICMFLEELLIP
ncbi:Rho GTPase activating protein 19 [Phyllostomus discolor]|uniref:Rho GTPase activating protein 19 n=1 Tax=Phyllostomus discolor TaxID=89673 RepID=A0A834A2G8_9CHIR|nr:Rho GTPase activating protein 19 [Phyllostomus discolor]